MDGVLTEEQLMQAAGEQPIQQTTSNEPPAEKILSDDQLQQAAKGIINPVDPATGERVPDVVSGKEADAPRQLNVLSVEDRLAVELGNEQGNINYLTKKYGDAKVNSKGQLVVKKDNEWYAADPKLWGDSNSPWEITKEIARDLTVDAVQEVTIGLAGTAGGAFGGLLGMGTAAALQRGLNTSLGRLIGTYESSPEDQVYDSLFEGLIEATLGKIMPGQKYGLTEMKQTVKNIADPANQAKPGFRVLTDTYGSLTVGKDNMRTAVDNGTRLLKRMDRFKKTIKDASSESQLIDAVKEDSVKLTKQITDVGSKALNRSYTRMRDEITKMVPDNFVGDPRKVSMSFYQNMVDSGFSKITRADGKPLSVDQIAGIKSYVQKNGELPKGINIKLRNPDELAKIYQSGAEAQNLTQAITNPKVYDYLKQMHAIFDLNSRGATKKGKAGARFIMERKKAISNSLYDLGIQADREGLPGIKKILDTARRGADENIADQFGTISPAAKNKFKTMNATYSEMADEFKILIDAKNKAAKQGDATFETLLNKLVSRPGKNILTKGQIGKVAAKAEALGDMRSAKEMKALETDLQINEAIIAFNPWVNKKVAAMNIATYAVFSLNLPLMATMGAGQVMTSPRVARGALRASNMAWKHLQGLKSMTPKQLRMLHENPEFAAAFTRSLPRALELNQAVSNELQSRMPQIPERIPEE